MVYSLDFDGSNALVSDGKLNHPKFYRRVGMGVLYPEPEELVREELKEIILI